MRDFIMKNNDVSISAFNKLFYLCKKMINELACFSPDLADYFRYEIAKILDENMEIKL
jgi:hypothetical protein